MFLATVIITFVASCIGLGYLAEVYVRRWKWPRWFVGVIAALIACLWPLLAFAYVIYTGQRYIAEHPGEANDAPALVLKGLISIGPFIFLLSLSLALLGLYLGRRNSSR